MLRKSVVSPRPFTLSASVRLSTTLSVSSPVCSDRVETGEPVSPRRPHEKPGKADSSRNLCRAEWSDVGMCGSQKHRDTQAETEIKLMEG